MNIVYYFLSGIMISFGIGFSISSIIHLLILGSSTLYAFGIFFGGLFIGLGLLIFPMRNVD